MSGVTSVVAVPLTVIWSGASCAVPEVDSWGKRKNGTIHQGSFWGMVWDSGFRVGNRIQDGFDGVQAMGMPWAVPT